MWERNNNPNDKRTSNTGGSHRNRRDRRPNEYASSNRNRYCTHRYHRPSHRDTNPRNRDTKAAHRHRNAPTAHHHASPTDRDRATKARRLTEGWRHRTGQGVFNAGE